VRFWDAGGRRNEALDLKVYNLAALHGLQALGFDLNAAAAALAGIPERTDDRPVTAPAIIRRKASRSSWLEG
jgi:phage terminase large subunit GpA-like protein